MLFLDKAEKKRIIEKFYKEKMNNEQNQYMHSSYQQEKKLINAIRIGSEVEAIKTLQIINENKKPILAGNSIRSLKNSIICSCTLFIRAGIEGGMHAESAFNLSDVFILQIEGLQTVKEVEDFEGVMVRTIIDQINRVENPIYTGITSKTINYIQDNLFRDLSLNKVANDLFVNPSYLSTLFKNETTYSITEYVNQKKIEESKYFLSHTDLSILEVSNLFDYCNQSYYTSLFKKYNGITPGKFKNENS